MAWSEKERAAAKAMFEADPAFKDAQGNQKWTWDDIPCDDFDPRRYWLHKARAALDAAAAVGGDAGWDAAISRAAHIVIAFGVNDYTAEEVAARIRTLKRG
jgi:hypothetical protein